MVFKTIPFGRSGIPPGARLGAACLHTIETAERNEHLGDGERSVRALVVLEEEHKGAADGASGAVERVDELCTAVGAEPRAKATGGEIRVVRTGRQLAVPAFGR